MEDTSPKSTTEMSASFLVLVSTILFGGVIVAVGCFVHRFFRTKHRKDEPKNVQKAEEHRRDSSNTVSGNNNVGAPSNKRSKNKKRRGAQQEFSHSWVVGTLKGHTAPVLDINFSSNGKFLASCAEDCGLRSKEEVLEPDAGRNEKVGNRETSSTVKTNGSKSNEQAIASRRKDKLTMDSPTSDESPIHASHPSCVLYIEEMKREAYCRYMNIRWKIMSGATPWQFCKMDDGEPNYKSSTFDNEKKNNSTSQSKVDARPRIQAISNPWLEQSFFTQDDCFISPERMALSRVSDTVLITYLKSYLLKNDEAWALGYPTLSGLGNTVIGNFVIFNQTLEKPYLDVNAREFIPRRKFTTRTTNESEADSGNGSGSSEENSDLEPESFSDSEKETGLTSSASSSSDSGSPQPLRSSNLRFLKYTSKSRICARCNKIYFVDRATGKQVYQESCTYHWGKLRRGYFSAAKGYMQDTWSCCKGVAQSRGCATNKVHVWTGLEYGCNGPYKDFVCTKQVPIHLYSKAGAYSLDCEMCFTLRGLELAKVTFIALDGSIVYDTLVKPETEIIDYNTRFSGITPSMLATATKTLKDVQKDILNFVYAETVLMGHGLENDLRALRINHPNVIDTSIVYPHSRGFPYRSSLQNLCRTILHKEIHMGYHDSVEDARAVLSLMLLKVNEDIP